MTSAAEVNEARQRLRIDGPRWTRDFEHDFEVVTLPERDCDILRGLLIREGVATVVEVGLAYGSSALAIGEALLTVGAPSPRHIIIDAFQSSAFSDVGWDVLGDAGLHGIATLTQAPSSLALAELVSCGFVADAAFVDGSHRFHEVFVDLYFLRKIVRPGGLVVLDDTWAPSVRTAVRYYERNLGWSLIADAFADGTLRHAADDPVALQVPRCSALRLPGERLEPPFESFRPLSGCTSAFGCPGWTGRRLKSAFCGAGAAS
jgi:predicted O-methyltransferase YrrM